MNDTSEFELTGADPSRDRTPKRGGGGLYEAGAARAQCGHCNLTILRLPMAKLSHGTMCFVGARGVGEFVLGIRQVVIFLFDPMCVS